ncbi:gliding motility-associated C-terminal domain-containing protein, partial [Reichenbachiella sp. MALMAid0571]|uniref:T9SS type B sorting domain-containing protein n=1 Tax=Reichenbachiella sp. MALMAid0571 TaxID=3143939 RepID=UPI0032E01231
GVTDNNDGTYTATVTNVVAETVTISGALDAVAITDDAEITFTVGSISVADTGTAISGVNLTRVADGIEAATITVQLKDVNGNDINTAGVEVQFSTTLGTLSNTGVVQTDANGQVSVTLTSTVAGTAEVTAQIDTDNDDGVDETVTNGSPVGVVFSADSNADTDGDGILDSDEDGNGDGNLYNDDCDQDGIPDFQDADLCAQMIMPNLFSPNGDGVDDMWMLPGLENYPSNRVTIYNRNGNKVSEIEGYNNSDRAWDGRATEGLVLNSGNGVPSGTYFYVIDLGDGSSIIKGFVVIRR